MQPGVSSAKRAGGRSTTHTRMTDQLPESANAELFGGWPVVLSGLKTLLKTGKVLTTPGSLRYGQG